MQGAVQIIIKVEKSLNSCIAITDELLLPYVRYCLKINISPFVSGYWNWAEDICNPNYMYLQQMALTFYIV